MLLSDMVEHCDNCGDELELGQIGQCDGCQCIEDRDTAPAHCHAECGEEAHA